MVMHSWKLFVMGLTMVGLVACNGGKADSQKADEPAKEEIPVAEGETPQPSILSGVVVESMDAVGYTYICVEGKDGAKTWAATPQMHVEVGQEIELEPNLVMTNFESKTLGRTFEEIVFCGAPAGQAAEQAAEQAADPHAGMSQDLSESQIRGFGGGKVAVPSANVKVEKASGPDAYTVSELYEKKADLDGKKVVVKAAVVKVSPGILGKNWIHLQDGTGEASTGTHDMVVTSQDLPSVGDVVTANGTLHTEKDFGYGYKYDVIVEEASVAK